MTKDEASTLQIRCNKGVWRSDYRRDTLIIEVGYMTAFDIDHLDGVMFDYINGEATP